MKTILQVEVRLLGAAIASLFALAPSPAAAQAAPSQNAPAQETGFGAASGIPWGPIVAYPTVTMTVKHDNNIYSQPNREKSSTTVVVAPRIKLEAKDGPHTYDITASVDDGRFSTASSADYTDYGLAANAKWVFSGRSGLALKAGYKKGHDEQGSVPGVGFHTKPDEWHQTEFSGVAGYGAAGAQGRIEVDFGLIDQKYDNFLRDRFGNPDNLIREYGTTRLGGTFFWRVMPKTNLLFRAARADISYDQNSFTYVGGPQTGTRWTNLDSTETTYQVGVTWEATALTTGMFRIGGTKKDYSKSNLKDFSDTSWDATVRWSPLSYSVVTFTTGQAPNESNIGIGSLANNYGVNWNHAWNSRVSSTAFYKYLKDEYQYNQGVPFKQQDENTSVGLGLNYQWTRNIGVGASYEYSERTSNNPRNEFNRNIFNISLNASI